MMTCVVGSTSSKHAGGTREEFDTVKTEANFRRAGITKDFLHTVQHMPRLVSSSWYLNFYVVRSERQGVGRARDGHHRMVPTLGVESGLIAGASHQVPLPVSQIALHRVDIDLSPVSLCRLWSPQMFQSRSQHLPLEERIADYYRLDPA